jgi:methionine aminopeptidase
MATPQLDLKKPDPAAAAGTEAKPDVPEEKLNADTLTKYQVASQLLGDVLKKFIPTIVSGKSVLELCDEGDALITSGCTTVYTNKKAAVPKGIAFPTSISINNVVSHFSPMPSDKDLPVLKDGDVVKVMMGCHIDGVSVARWI